MRAKQLTLIPLQSVGEVLVLADGLKDKMLDFRRLGVPEHLIPSLIRADLEQIGAMVATAQEAVAA